MLILTRRVGTTIMIGDEVTVTVLAVKGDQIRIGINAPKHVAVHREEVYERIRSQWPQGIASDQPQETLVNAAWPSSLGVEQGVGDDTHPSPRGSSVRPTAIAISQRTTDSGATQRAELLLTPPPYGTARSRVSDAREQTTPRDSA